MWSFVRYARNRLVYTTLINLFNLLHLYYFCLLFFIMLYIKYNTLSVLHLNYLKYLFWWLSSYSRVTLEHCKVYCQIEAWIRAELMHVWKRDSVSSKNDSFRKFDSVLRFLVFNLLISCNISPVFPFHYINILAVNSESKQNYTYIAALINNRSLIFTTFVNKFFQWIL